MGEFINLVVRAGRTFVAAKGKDPAKEGAALAEYLLSERPLGADERQTLAELVTGQWRNGTGRKEISPGNPKVVEVVAALRKLEAEGCKKEAAKMQVAADFGVTRGTVENYERMVREREEATKRHGVRPKPQTNK